MKNIYRHGDLGFIQLTEKPKGLKEEKFDGEFILALGEHTGYAHRLTATKDAVKVYKDTDGSLVLEILGKALLTHEEHREIEFVPGIYRMGHEREYDYYLDEIAKVQD